MPTPFTGWVSRYMEETMDKIIFDSGLRKYELGRGILSFNPLDPNLYDRFAKAAEKFAKLEDELVAEVKNQDAEKMTTLAIMKRFDEKAKNLLNEVFGAGNDFDEMLAGVNLMAVAENGERVITNLLHALTPILEQGAKDCAASFLNNVK